MKSGSRLERVLAEGRFAVTAELGPPMGGDPRTIIEKAALLQGAADAFNVTDNQTAVVRMSSIAASALCLGEGLEPVMQMVCRDRNRIALQSDLLGAVALGIRNCLCLSGDHQSFGKAGKLHGHPGSKNVYDVDSINLISILKTMRDKRRLQGGDKVAGSVPIFIGAAWTPLAEPVDFRLIRLEKKIEAGADFIQTQGIYDAERFSSVMKKVRKLGLHEKTAILVGIIVPKSAGMLRYMDKKVPGVTVPGPLIERMEQAKDPKEEGVRVTVELIDEFRRIKGVRGVHIQSIEWEAAVPEIVRRAGLLPRPSVR